MIKHLKIILAFLMTFSSPVAAASNEETIQYIFDQHEAGCIAEQYEVLTAKEGETPLVTVELELDDDNIYEMTIDSDGKKATVLYAEFSCTGIGYAWCGSSGCATYVIVDGVSYTTRGKPVSVQVGDRYVVLIPRSGGGCHNSADIGLSNAALCYTAAVWDSSRNTFNSASSSQYVLTISDFEP
jgi:hypothetical protein